MKHSFLFIFLLVIAAMSCNNKAIQSKEATNTKDTLKVIENKIMIPASSCYSSTTGKDTAFLKVEVFPNAATGRLSYKFHEKDNNRGDFEGRLHGDTLLADYKFMSEGIQSTRQVIFLIQDNAAIEGYGNMEEKNGKWYLKIKGKSFSEKG